MNDRFYFIFACLYFVIVAKSYFIVALNVAYIYYIYFFNQENNVSKTEQWNEIVLRGEN